MKFSFITISFFVAILCITHAFRADDVIDLVIAENICPTPVPAKWQGVKPGKIVSAYVASWDKYGNGYSIKDDLAHIAHKITHIFYAFAVPNGETGSCDLLDPWADVGANFEHRKKVGGHFGQLLALKKQFPHLKIILSLGGGAHSKPFSQLIEKGLLKNFVESCMKLFVQYEYQYQHTKTGEIIDHTFTYEDLFNGFDIDWEWSANKVSEQDASYYLMLAKALRKALDKKSKKTGKSYLLTSALQVHRSVLDTLPLAEAAKIFDWFNVMAYDFTSPTTMDSIGFNAPICNPWSRYSVDNAVNNFMRLGVSPEKLVLGIPLYGHVFDGTRGKIGSPFQKTEVSGSLPYDQIKEKYLENPDCAQKWHSGASVPYIYCPADQIFVSYDDKQSIQEKLNFAKFKHLKGVVFWRLSGDDNKHNLLNSLQF